MYLQRQLSKEFSPAIRQRGAEIHASREVTLISGDRYQVFARVRGSRVYNVRLTREDGEFHVCCDCPFFESDCACKHIWATILAAEGKSYLLGIMGGRPLRLVEDEP